MDTEASPEATKHWLGRLTKLNPATGRGECRGKAPHKPLLLLALLDMAEAGELSARAITRSPGLVLRFRSYGAIVCERWPTRLDVKMPFYHLSTQGFWQPFTAAMQTASSPDNCAVCEMDSELFTLLADPGFRLKARMILISKYFEPAERIALFETLGLQVGSEGAPERVLKEAVEAAKRKGRSARFAVRVVAEYRYTCALTGYRCDTDEGATIVDAAHIEMWAATQNDDPTNGLALSKSAHWMFDEGLWSADDDLRVVVHRHRFAERGPESFRLNSFVGRHLQFDPAAKLRPALEYLRRHRQYHGFRE
ncbi:MAG TPA: HNH endonuclease [Planctomycetota bacterium]|jgi:putative restriction endonuclease